MYCTELPMHMEKELGRMALPCICPPHLDHSLIKGGASIAVFKTSLRLVSRLDLACHNPWDSHPLEATFHRSHIVALKVHAPLN